MLGKSLRSAVVLCLALTACNGAKGRKISISKSIQGKGQVGEWTADDQLVARDQKGKVTCFKLNRLIELVEKLDSELVVIHPVDLNFGRLVSGGAKGGDDARFEALPEDLSKQKAALFLRGARKEAMLEIGAAKSIRESRQVGSLFALTAQQDCSTVLFTNGQRFSIVGSSGSNGLRLLSDQGDEARSYVLAGQGRGILVSVTRTESNIPDCGTGVTQRLVRRAYFVTPAKDLQSINIGGNLAKLLADTVYSTPELEATVDMSKSAPKTDKEKKTARPPMVSDRRGVGFPTWEYIKTLVDSGQGKLKDVACSAK